MIRCGLKLLLPAILIGLLASTALSALPAGPQTNNVFDNAPTLPLKHPETILISGEIEKEMEVKLAGLPRRSVAVKEVSAEDGRIVFRGAYRYDGYSLADILNRVVIKKRNAEEFPRIIDLYLEVENETGEKVCFSWGEIFYPNNMHRILIAASVSRFVPQLTKELWPLPAESKIVAGTDLLTVRGLRRPTRITVKSFDIRKTGPAGKADGSTAAAHLNLLIDGKSVAEFVRLPADLTVVTYPSTLYGQGKGFLGNPDLTGVPLAMLLGRHIPVSEKSLAAGLVAFIAADGYRAVFSLSELVNRNDHQEALLMSDVGGTPGFSMYASGDFYFDRAVNRIVKIEARLTFLP